MNNVDLSLLKKTEFLEGTFLELRLEALNAFNHPRFGFPNTSPTASSFGQVSAPPECLAAGR